MDQNPFNFQVIKKILKNIRYWLLFYQICININLENKNMRPEKKKKKLGIKSKIIINQME